MLDAQTGEVLALANCRPTTRTTAASSTRERMRNRAVTDLFEPGSTLKPFTVAAALEAGKVQARDA